MAKVTLVDFEIIGLTEIAKTKFKKNETEAEHVAHRACLLATAWRDKL